MRPELAAQQQFHQSMMRGMPNGAMNMAMKPGQLQRAAMANNQKFVAELPHAASTPWLPVTNHSGPFSPQTMQMLHQQKAAGQMQRDPSDMDGNRARPASPGGAENAPSPSKRPRLDGGAPFNPNQTVMMPNGRPGQGMPGQQQVGNGPDTARTVLLPSDINPFTLNPDHLQTFASAAPPHVQAKIATYSTNMTQHHGNQMPNKPMPNAAGPQGQGSPMVPPGPDGNSLNQYYNPGDMGPGNMRPGGAPNGQAAAGSNHALQDYQMQLMLLEQQNKKRLMMARQEQDLGTGTGPGGPAGPGAPPGPNAPAFQGTSPPGGRSGASPNPAEQMKRANQQMAGAANMGSPLPDGAGQSRNSPGSMNFIGANIDPNLGPSHFGMNMNMGAQMNGAMRPPSSHPPFNGQMTPQQMLAARQAQQGHPGPQGAPMQWPQGGPNGQMPGQPPQGQVQGAPAQNPRAMPPPSAPAAAAAAANARNTTASPQVSNAAPPTPQQASKAAPKKKETKSSKAKVCSQNPYPKHGSETDLFFPNRPPPKRRAARISTPLPLPPPTRQTRRKRARHRRRPLHLSTQQVLPRTKMSTPARLSPTDRLYLRPSCRALLFLRRRHTRTPTS